jgi:branched-chain amino acid transport system ATP-binding protein
MLAVARALMSRPRLLLLDEPSLGLAPKVIAEIFAVLDELRAQGLTMLLVEQDAQLALKRADRGYVMRTGRVVLEGPAEELLADETVRTIYLGAWQGEGEGS